VAAGKDPLQPALLQLAMVQSQVVSVCSAKNDDRVYIIVYFRRFFTISLGHLQVRSLFWNLSTEPTLNLLDLSVTTLHMLYRFISTHHVRFQ